MTAADNSGDGKLTLSEMVSNPYVFYGSSGAHACCCMTTDAECCIAIECGFTAKVTGSQHQHHWFALPKRTTVESLLALLHAVVDEEETEAPVHDEF